MPHTEASLSDLLLADPMDAEALLRQKTRLAGDRKLRASLEHAEAAAQKTANKDVRLALLCWLLDRPAKAAEHAAKAPSDPYACLVAGHVLAADGKGEEALKQFQKAAQLAPTSAPCALAPIEQLRRLGRPDEALQLAERLRKQFSDKADFAYFEGRASEDAGQHQAALDAYRAAIAIDPQHVEATFRAAYLSDLRGLDREARELYERLGPASPTPYLNACLNLALIYEDEGEYDQAVRCCKTVLRAEPANARAKLFLSDIEASSTMYYSPEETKQSERLEAVLRVPVSDFELSVRSRNCLANMNIVTLGDLVKKTESEMLAYKNFGETSLREIKEVLMSKGLRLGMMREDAATRQAAQQRKNQNLEILSKSIDELELGVRSRKCMETLGVTTIGDLAAMSEADLATARNFGRVSLNEIKRKLAEIGLSLRSPKDGESVAVN